MWKVRPSFTHLLIIGNFALFVFLFVQIPRTTSVLFVFAPRVPAGLCTGPVSAGTEPRRELTVAVMGNPLDGGSRYNLFDGRTIRMAPAVVLPEGLWMQVSDPLLSLGAQRIDAAGVDCPGLSVNFGITTPEDLNNSQSLPRHPQRECVHRGEPIKLKIDGLAFAGKEQKITVDTTPVWFLIPDSSWDAFVDDRCGISYSGFGGRTRLFGGSQPPRGGVDLSYAIEDELTGTPLPFDLAVTVIARAVDYIAVHGLASACKKSIGRMDAACFRELNALPAGRCGEVWPVTVDKGRSVIHVSRAAGSPPACDLVLSVVPAHGDGPIHVAFLELWDSPREAP
jgi:hypothetical protein